MDTEKNTAAMDFDDIIGDVGVSRRTFLARAGMMGMGVAGLAALAGCGNAAANDAASDESSNEASKSTNSEWVDVGKSDDLMQKVLQESEVTGDLPLDNGTFIPAVYVRMRNRINRIGRGIGSTPADGTSYDMIKYLWSEEDAEHYLEMPLHKYFTAGDYAAVSGRSEEECSKILEDQADRCLIWRVRRGGLPFYVLMPYINGFWEFNELKAYYSGVEGSVAEFDMQGIKGADPHDTSGFDTTFPLFRSYPIDVDVVEGDALAPFHDWRALIKRNSMITVSPCQCRTMWEALGVPYNESHPHRTCLSLGEMAEYFIENGIGEQITQDEAISIVEDIIDHGMVVESICAKDADIICACHCESCGNLIAYRACNGQAACANYYSAYLLNYDKDACIACGSCVERCPMHSITLGDDGVCIMDDACVRCGQCVAVCPAKARILKVNPNYPELPTDYVDCNRYFAKDRMQRGQLVDFVEGELTAKPAAI
ncbi:4Fe-4S binding protein [Slackia exigua]|uniref:4Fe-4S binding protein n=1 Tax=Slackia exigua TaxID=84109 RepID=UPI0028D011FE|nr:4Fe-4S binding protein [Slackia exigua]